MTDRLWYYMQNGRQMGPVPQEALRSLVAHGAVAPDTLTWAEGMPQWTPLSQVELAPAQPPPLSPSEVVLLHGSRFSPMGKGHGPLFTMPTSGVQVSAPILVTAMYTVAALANEQAGLIRLTVQPKKAMLGLRTVTTVMAELAGTQAPWPQGSPEWHMHRYLSQYRRPMELRDLYTVLLQSDSDPTQQALRSALAALAVRGLLQQEAVKTLLVFTSYRYSANGATMAAAAAQPPASIEDLLAQTRRTRFDLLQNIEQQFASAIASRTVTPNTSDE